MSIIDIPLQSVSYSQIVAFCEQSIREHPTLDYKSDLPSGLHKTVASMANTLGGIIIIGVKDADGLPKPPFEGIQYRRGIEEQITSICLDNIVPPVVPLVQVIQGPSDKCFVLIRVPQSSDTPHAINNNSEVYVRANSQSFAEQLLTIDKLEWLLQKREPSIALRNKILQKSLEHYQNLTFSDSQSTLLWKGSLSLFVSPLYPHSSLVPYEQISNILRKCVVVTQDRDEYPDLSNRPKPILEGVYHHDIVAATIWGIYLEANLLGPIYLRQTLRHRIPSVTSRTDIIFMNHLLRSLLVHLEFCTRWFDKLNYFGDIFISLSIDNLDGLSFLPLHHGNQIDPTPIRSDTSIEFQRTLLHHEFHVSESRDQLAREISRHIAWAFGHEYTPDSLKGYYKDLISKPSGGKDGTA